LPFEKRFDVSTPNLPPVSVILGGPHWPGRVRVVQIEPRGTSRVLVEVVTLDAQSRLISCPLGPEDLTVFEVQVEPDQSTLTDDPTDFRLAAEPTRIHLVHTYDP
jgi:hypothetical protein